MSQKRHLSSLFTHQRDYNSRRHITQQNLLFLIVGFLKNRKSVVDIMNPKLEEIALPFSEIQERMFKLHKLNPWMFVCAP